VTPAEEAASLQRQLNAIDRQLAQNMLGQYKPYPKQLQFHAAGADPSVRERLLVAGNQLGKTLSASREAAMHSTGMYASWWPGVMFAKPNVGWAASITSQGTRDTVQRMLLGQPGAFGTGAIPKALLKDYKKATHGVADAIETIVVKHIAPFDNPHRLSDGDSRITLKTYDQGRERWQGDTLHWVWFDEEPDKDIYTEGLTRTNATGGIAFMTFTPLLGMSDVVKRFVTDKAVGTHTTTMTIEDALHYTPEQRRLIVAAYPAHERDARARGIPILGSGRIFPFEDSQVAEPPLQIPNWWPRGVGLDFGYDHPFAAVWGCWDRDTDTVHIYDAYKKREGGPAVHTAVLRAKGVWIPVFWPHDGETRDARGSGVTHAQQYRDMGVNMWRERATHAPAKGQKEGEGGISLEAGLTLMFDRIQTGRLKVAKHLTDWFEEFRLYHRKDGLVVRENDDLMSATLKLLMMLRHTKVYQPPREPTVRGWQPTVPGMGMLG
jgi:phage terminase large subunit-like protein